MMDREPADDTTTGELLLRYRDGDRAALDRVCRRYLPAIRRWAHGRRGRSRVGGLRLTRSLPTVTTPPIWHRDLFVYRY